MAFGAVIAALVVATTLIWVGTHSNPVTGCRSNAPTNYPGGKIFQLAACGSTVDLAPHSFASYTIPRFSDSLTLFGQYFANGSVGAYLVNSTVLSELRAHPNVTAPPSNYVWTCGAGTNCTLAVKVPGSPAQYYLVLENTAYGSVTLRWTEALVVFYLPTIPV